MAIDKDLGELLGQHPFFADMVPELKEILVGCARNERFAAGEYLYREGQQADRFFLLRHGRVALELQIPGKPPIVLETVDAGEVTGWSWLVPPFQWAMDARAATLVRAISLDATCLRGKCESDHSVGYELYKRFIPIMGRRLHAARRQLLDVYGSPG
jgi:CRP-like cAMP-binding protein